MTKKLKMECNSEGIPVVFLEDIIFKNKQNINWDAVEKYLQKYVGEIIEIQIQKISYT